MFYANDSNGQPIEAAPGLEATCPQCGATVRARCGEIVAWHWAHEANDCDPWHEDETEWHRAWKSRFPRECREVSIGGHRADVRVNGLVIELQNSPISPEEIQERERFYGRMIWVFNGNNFAENVRFRLRDGYVSFRWKWPRKSIWHARRPVYWDMVGYVQKPRGHYEYDPDTDEHEFIEHGDPFRPSVFKIGKIHHSVPCGGYGHPTGLADFMLQYGVRGFDWMRGA